MKFARPVSEAAYPARLRVLVASVLRRRHLPRHLGSSAQFLWQRTRFVAIGWLALTRAAVSTIFTPRSAANSPAVECEHGRFWIWVGDQLAPTEAVSLSILVDAISTAPRAARPITHETGRQSYYFGRPGTMPLENDFRLASLPSARSRRQPRARKLEV
jgi:aromatic ring-cleaving dioxygenase